MKYNERIILICVIAILISQIACSIQKNSESIPTICPTITIESTAIPTICPTETIEFPEIKYAITNVEVGLNIRKNADENSEIVFTIPANKKIRIVNPNPINGNWYYVAYDIDGIKSYVGYVNGDYLEFQK